MNDKLGLYIHIPFCSGKCPYCDFYSKAVRTEDVLKYTDELLKSIEYWSKQTNRKITSVYFGGGTPNMLGTDNLCKVLNKVFDCFNVLEEAEITTELNPTYSDSINFIKLKTCGFNRLSFGMQSANDDELKILGRKHTTDEVKKVIELAQNAGFSNISLDLMLGVPKQTKESLKKSIEFCSSCKVKHISAYILKVEENTPFYKNKDILDIPDEDTQADLYSFACEQLENLGYYQYEISNFANEGFESKHNLTYWQCEEYIGIGPSAHSFFNGERFYYNRSFEDFYNNKIIKDCIGGTKEEYIMLNLRLSNGINFDDYKKRFNEDFPTDILKSAEKFKKFGFLDITDKSIKLNKKGFLLSNAIISELI